ncbi:MULTISPECIES: HNH endonuclease [Butyricimonas]|uniref:HNH endonuclease n=1 Tax=Butyricimonas TaxID=574697 RepID=UPI0007FB4CFC|nr:MULTISPECIES: HNH endonuclease [Butyricimonas]
MEAIERKEDIYENIAQVEKYLACEEGNKLQLEMIELIRGGHKFVSYKVYNEWHFVPSKYIGYKNNNLKVHKANKKAHSITGSKTNRFITKVLEIKHQPNEVLEKAYHQFCQHLGIPANKIHKRIREFWELSVPEKYFASVLENGYEYTEGKIKEVNHHKYRGRDSKLIQAAKAKFKINHEGRLYCEICGFNFRERYGDAGYDFIEAHHIKPISEMDEEGEITDINDLIMVCSNCHSIIHRRNPFYTIEEMKNIINLNS